MSKSSDPEHFFQTSSSLAASTRKAQKSTNTSGNPVKLPSKILALIPDPTSNDAVYVAESAGTARRIALDVDSKDEIFRSPASTAPLTSLALSLPSSSSSSAQPHTLFAGSWDKTIHSWSLNTNAPSRRLTGGHLDFIKCLVSTTLKNGEEVLISGSADATIVLWDVVSGVKLQVLRGGHTRGVLALIVYPYPYFTTTTRNDEGDEGNDKGVGKEKNEAQGDRDGQGGVMVFSGGSDREIRRFALTLRLGRPHLEEVHAENPIIVHETSVNALAFDSEGDLWTASADGTAKCLSRDHGWEADTVLRHGEGDYVRAIVVDEINGWVITGGRSEEIRIWDKGKGEVVDTYGGHFDEITSLVMLDRRQEVVSGSIDGTVRRWSVDKQDIARAKKEAETDNDDGGKDEEGKGKIVITEEEDRELEALMNESE